MELQSGAAHHLLGFEDESLGSSPGWRAATVATYLYCTSRVVEHSKSKSTKPSPRAHGTPCTRQISTENAVPTPVSVTLPKELEKIQNSHTNS